MDKFSRLTPGVYSEPGPAFADVPQVGSVVSVSAAGARVVLDEMPGQVFGPAPWSLGAFVSVAAAITGGGYPHPGDRVLVVFAGVGVGTTVVVAWWR